MKSRPDPSPDQYPTIEWPELESMIAEGCPCCDQSYTSENRLDLISRCHPKGRLSAGYWDGYIYLTCMECGKPIVRIPISQRLIA